MLLGEIRGLFPKIASERTVPFDYTTEQLFVFHTHCSIWRIIVTCFSTDINRKRSRFCGEREDKTVNLSSSFLTCNATATNLVPEVERVKIIAK